MLDPGGIVSFWNPSAARIFGYEAREVLGRPLPEVLYRRGRPLDVTRLFRAACRGDGQRFDGRVWELQALRKDGRRLPVDVSLATFKVDDEWQGVGIIRDVTQRQQIEAALREREGQLHQALEAANLGTWDWDCESGRVIWGGRYRAILGEAAEEISTFDAFCARVHPEDREAFRRVFTESRDANGIFSYRHRLEWPDGQVRWVAERGGCVIDEETGAVRMRGIISDITERVEADAERARMQAQIDQAQKLESIGRLAAGIAHEINTPTQYIGDNTRFLRDGFRDLLGVLEKYREICGKMADGGDAAALLAQAAEQEKSADLEFILEEIPLAIEQSLEGVARVSKIVGAMKDFSHPGVDEMTAINLNHAIESTVEVARSEWKYVATMQLDLEPSLAPVVCHPGQINQVILNLVVNAAHAIAEKFSEGDGSLGEIRISTRTDGDHVEIAVADNGNGIPESVRHKIFTPFFTTKEVGKGTGQGLALARSVVVDQHGGTIDFESEEGVGTTFRIRLPFSQEETRTGETQA